MAKPPKKYVITCERGMFETRSYKSPPLTIEEAWEYYGYTLECGRSYQHEKGNKKINCKPTTIKSLLKNLYNAGNNAARNGYAGRHYSAEEVVVFVDCNGNAVVEARQ